MLFYSLYFFAILLLLSKANIISNHRRIFYAKRGDTVELCDNRTTLIYAYEYRSFDGRRSFILEPMRYERYSNPYLTSLLRIVNVVDSDSGQYKCPQDDIEWQKLQVYGKGTIKRNVLKKKFLLSTTIISLSFSFRLKKIFSCGV